MIIDHVRGVHRSISSPEAIGSCFGRQGFILTSGLLAGLVYRRVVNRDGLAAAVRRIWLRDYVFYLVTIALTLLLLPISELLGLPWAQGLNMDRPLELVISVLTLHQTYYLADVLLLYTVPVSRHARSDPADG